MSQQEAAPETVGVFRRLAAVVLCMTVMFFLIMCMPWMWGGPKTKRLFSRAYDWLFATVLRINPNF